MRQHSDMSRVGRLASTSRRRHGGVDDGDSIVACEGVVDDEDLAYLDNSRKSSGWIWYPGECSASPVCEISTSPLFPRARCSTGAERMALTFATVFSGKSISWYTTSGVGDVEAVNRKTRVSVPAPNEMICFFFWGCDSTKRETRQSIAVVRTYVPV